MNSSDFKSNISKQSIKIVKDLFARNIEEYSKKQNGMSDTDWLKTAFLNDDVLSAEDAEDIVKGVDRYSNNIKEINEAAEKGISKEQWLADKIEKESMGMSAEQYGKNLVDINNAMCHNNEQMDASLNGYNAANDAGTGISAENQDYSNTEYSDYKNREIALNIGKRAAAYAFQSIAGMSEIDFAKDVLETDSAEANKIVEGFLQGDNDTGLKTIAAAALKKAVAGGNLPIIPKDMSTQHIAGLACAGVDNAKVLYKVANGELSLTKGIEYMGRSVFSVVGSVISDVGIKYAGKFLDKWLPGSSIVINAVSTVTGFLAGSEKGKAICSAAKRTAAAAKGLAKAAMSGLRKTAQAVGQGIKNAGKAILNFFS